MGVKSTIALTRLEAEGRYYELVTALMRKEGLCFSDVILEAALEELNDAAHNGEGFENYTISRDRP
jgi:hypothetical protein